MSARLPVLSKWRQDDVGGVVQTNLALVCRDIHDAASSKAKSEDVLRVRMFVGKSEESLMWRYLSAIW